MKTPVKRKASFYGELFSYTASGRVNIRIHRDIEGKMWFGVGHHHADKIFA